MDRKVWDSSVTLIMEGGRRLLTIRSPREAFDVLFGKWPTANGKAYLWALTACADVAEGAREPEEAYEAFLDAAREARIPVLR